MPSDNPNPTHRRRPSHISRRIAYSGRSDSSTQHHDSCYAMLRYMLALASHSPQCDDRDLSTPLKIFPHLAR